MLNKFFDKFKSKKDDEEIKNTKEDLQQDGLETDPSNEYKENSEEIIEDKEDSEVDYETNTEQIEEISEEKEESKEGFLKN